MGNMNKKTSNSNEGQTLEDWFNKPYHLTLEDILEKVVCLFKGHDWGFYWIFPEKPEQGYKDYCGLVRESIQHCQRCGIRYR